MALPVANTLEGGTNGTTLTNGNSGGASGTAFDDITTVAGGSLAFDSANVLTGHGSLCMVASTGGTAGNSFAGWTNTVTGTSAGTFSGRFYFKTGTLATFTSSRIYSVNSASGVVCFSLIYTRATNIVNVNDTSGSNIGSAGSALSQNTWYRIEYQCTPSTTAGQVLVRFYSPVESATVFTSITTASNVNLGATNLFGNVRHGIGGTSVASAGPYYYDDSIVQAGAAWIGSSAGLGQVVNLVTTPISSSQINLTWDAVSGATGYEVQRDSVTIAYDVSTNAYSDTGLSPSTTYAYKVRAIKD